MDIGIIEKLTTFFDAKPEIILALLYGSCSRGTETGKSDVDIAVAMCETLSLDDRLFTIGAFSAFGAGNRFG